MSAKATFWAWDREIKPATAKLVLLCLADCHNEDTRQCNPSVAFIARKSGLDKKTVPVALKTLETMGFITIERRTGTSAQYWLNIEPVSNAGQCANCGCFGGGGDKPVSQPANSAEHSEQQSAQGSADIPKSHSSVSHDVHSKSKVKSGSAREAGSEGGSVVRLAARQVDSQIKSMPLPRGLSCEAWVDWIDYRQQSKKPVTPIGAKRTLAFLAVQPEPDAVIDRSIRNGWSGLFKLKKNNHSNNARGGFDGKDDTNW